MRFKLKTPFLTQARDAIKGGIWYKPSWWDAVRRVPPLGLLPRRKKKEIPVLRFVEDRLIRNFEVRNPMITAHDSFDLSSGENTVAGTFAAKQLEAMAADVPEEESYKVAEDWTVEHGREMIDKLNLEADVLSGLERNPVEEDMSPAQRRQELFHQQWLSIKQGLRQDLIENPPPPTEYAGVQDHRTFLSASEIDDIQQRRLGANPVYPTLESSDDEADLAADAAVADYEEGSGWGDEDDDSDSDDSSDSSSD